MLNGKASSGDSTALERARAWLREGLSLRHSLNEELAREVEARDLHAARVREIERALADLPTEVPPSDEGQAVLFVPTRAEAEKREPGDLSATELVRVLALRIGGQGRAKDIVGMAKNFSERHPPRALYNALHRLVKIGDMSSAGSQGDMVYTLTAEGRARAEEIAKATWLLMDSPGAGHVVA